MPGGTLRIYQMSDDDDRALAVNGAQVGIIDMHGTHAPALLFAGGNGESAIADVDTRERAEGARLGSIGANGIRTVHERVIKQPAHAVREQRLDMLARRKTPCLTLHVRQ